VNVQAVNFAALSALEFELAVSIVRFEMLL